ncbi:antibiotic biosynthesis monooxygenase family protein [Methylovirgula sp. 4M-Z18]|uniref:antibiotic biosynthesis monooxygenase family protein n=1 Tax=Methylovirgula sp. 4M-Z18 TaxID=2293567 RepID=UPI001314E0E5|nr:antibiotic biosynthesis monooxygenase [Methylovirgula sp. 4M-Z18]
MDQTRREMTGLLAGLAAAGLVSEAMAAQMPVLTEHPMVARIWHGRTPAAKADEYRQYLYEAGVKKIAALPGNRGVQMMVSKTADEGEFMVISYWDSIDAIKGYAGEQYTHVHDLPRDQEFLIDKETLVRHFALDVNLWQS